MMAEALVIFLHGVGSRGAGLAGLGTLWAARLPGAVFAAPDAPYPFDQGGPGRQWFSVSGVTEANRAGRIADARADFDRVIGDKVRDAGFEGRLDRVALVGFSQGSIMALDGVATGRWPVGAVLAYSGRLATPDPLQPAPGRRLMLVHGEEDRIIPVSETILAEQRLRAAGCQVSTLIEPGQGHGISPDGSLRGVEFLSNVLEMPAEGEMP